MKKIVVQSESCIGCGACVGIDSEHFEFSDDGFSVVKSQENLDSVALQDAIDACPVAIISLENTTEEGTSDENHAVDSHSETEVEEENQEHDCNHCKHCECHEEKKAA